MHKSSGVETYWSTTVSGTAQRDSARRISIQSKHFLFLAHLSCSHTLTVGAQSSTRVGGAPTTTTLVQMHANAGKVGVVGVVGLLPREEAGLCCEPTAYQMQTRLCHELDVSTVFPPNSAGARGASICFCFDLEDRSMTAAPSVRSKKRSFPALAGMSSIPWELNAPFPSPGLPPGPHNVGPLFSRQISFQVPSHGIGLAGPNIPILGEGS